MIRRAFVMSVNPGQEQEYEKRHTPVWEEMAATLHAHGVTNYSIFLDPQTNMLFAYAEIESLEKWKAIAQTDVCQRWWKHMKDIMPSHPNNSPISRDLREVFHMD